MNVYRPVRLFRAACLLLAVTAATLRALLASGSLAPRADLPPCGGGSPDGLYDYPLTAPSTVTVGGVPLVLAVADFDADGRTDVAVLTDRSAVVIYRHGSSGLEKWAEVSGPAAADRLLAQDVDRDGRLDLIVTSRARGKIRYLRGTGGSDFAMSAEYLMPQSVSDVAVVDLDGDDVDDLVVATTGEERGAIDWFPGRATGGFDMAGRRLYNYGVNTLTRADVTRDGRPDLVATTEDTCCDASARLLAFVLLPAVLPGAPLVTRLVFSRSAPPALGDFNGDGLIDVYQWPDLYHGSGDGRFTLSPQTLDARGTDGIAADLDGDGSSDLVLRRSTNASLLDITYSGAGGRWSNPVSELSLPTNIRSVAAIDWNHDRWMDLAVALDDGRTLVVPGDARLAWSDLRLVDGSEFTDQQLADFNGDGHLDIGLTSYYRSDPRQAWRHYLDVFLTNPDGSLAEPARLEGLGGSLMAAGDVDADGRVDLVLVMSGRLGVARGQGDGGFSGFGDIGVAVHPVHWLSLADLNDDGRLDIVTRSGGIFSAFLQQADQRFVAGPTTAVGGSSGRCALGDLDGDGHLDLVAMTTSADQLRAFLGRGDGSFTAGAVASTGRAPCDVLLSDFDLDGQLEAVTSDKPDSTLSVRTYRADGQFGPRTILRTPAMPQGLTAGDVDGDGRPDLISANPGVVFLSRCTGGFSATSPRLYMGTAGVAAALVDFANDGHPALADWQAYSAHVFLHRGVATLTPCADLTAWNITGSPGHTVVSWQLRGYATSDRFRLFRVDQNGGTTLVDPAFRSGSVRYSVLDTSPDPRPGYLLEMAGSNGRVERISLTPWAPPIPLVAAFTAARSGPRVQLHWTLSRSEPTVSFRLLRAVAGGALVPVGATVYRGASAYEVLDALPSRRATEYWLLVTAADGAAEYAGPAAVSEEVAAQPLVTGFVALRYLTDIELRWAVPQPDPRVTLRLFRQVGGGARVAVDSTEYAAAGNQIIQDVPPPVIAADYWLRLDWLEGEVEWVGPAHVGPYVAHAPELALRVLSGNPMRDEVRIEYETLTDDAVTVRIYDANGRRVRTLREGHEAAGPHPVAWAGDDESGALAPSGLYFVRLEVPAGSRVVRVVRVR